MKREDLLAYRRQLQRKIEAIDILLEGEDDCAASPTPARSRTVAPSLAEKERDVFHVDHMMDHADTTLIQAIHEFVSRVERPFKKSDMERSIRERHPKLDFNPKSLSNPLIKLVKDGAVEITRGGAGKVPNIYRKVEVVPAAKE